MTFDFRFNTEEQGIELLRILEIECKKHFGKQNKGDLSEGTDWYVQRDSYRIRVFVWDPLYFADIQKMKESVYEQNASYEELHEVLLEDWMSDVEENLSFCPKVSVR